MKEADFMRRCMKRATDAGARLWRNNVGVLPDKRGIPVRYGLHPGSSDLIGFVPVTVTADMVGKTLAVFVSVETKTKAGRATKEQEQWLAMVAKHGGRAGIARVDQDLDQIIGVDHDLVGPGSQ